MMGMIAGERHHLGLRATQRAKTAKQLSCAEACRINPARVRRAATATLSKPAATRARCANYAPKRALA
jgi:hypothetical protein